MVWARVQDTIDSGRDHDTITDYLGMNNIDTREWMWCSLHILATLVTSSSAE